MKRNLDGVYFRIKQEDGTYDDICFSDLTPNQQDEIMQEKSEEWLRSMCKRLAEVIKELGDEFDLVCK